MNNKTYRLVGLSLLTALVVVLTLLGNIIKVGPFAVTLSLTPIITGAAVFGAGAGAALGLVFGIVVLIAGAFGLDGGATLLLLSQSVPATVGICIVKGVAAGYLAGKVFEWVSKKNTKTAVLCSGIVCPVVNTGLFIAGMLMFFFSTLESWSGGQAMLYYIVVGLTGINFLIEMTINIVLSSSETYIISHIQRFS